MSINEEPIRLIGYFPPTDPAMVQVLLSLANDRDKYVRDGVAYYLGQMPANELTITTLIRMTEDEFTQRSAILSLGRIGPDAMGAIPALEKCRATGYDEIKLCVDMALVSIDPRHVDKK